MNPSKTKELRLTCDYGAESPLWLDGHGMTEPEELGLSRDLAARLRAWAATFNDAYHWEYGWSSTADPVEFAAIGRNLRDQLEQEVGRRYRVRLRLP